MTRSKTLLTAVLALVMLLLAACSSGPVKEVYTATGDINDPAQMTKTSSFRTDDDLNVVVTLNSHNRELPVYALFTAPDGTGQYSTDELEVGVTAGKVLLGLDWEMAGSIPWPVGEWKVEVFVDQQVEGSATFEVMAPTPAPAG